MGDGLVAVQKWWEVVCKQGDSLWLMAQGFLACPAALEQRAQEQHAVLDCQGKAAKLLINYSKQMTWSSPGMPPLKQHFFIISY